MKISYKWLQELTGLEWPPDEMGERLTLCGTACEYIEPIARYMDCVVVGEVLEVGAVEGADKIQRTLVNTGAEKLVIICGAPNVAVGQKVPVATIGAKLAGDFTIKKAKIRGVESFGMICSERELGLSDNHEGIMVLPEDAVPGTPLKEYLDFDDYILTFELTPNRPDSMSAIGIARDLAALTGVKVKRPEFEVREGSAPASDCISIKIDDPVGCPRYAARVIKNVKVGPSPWWVKKKLITAGMRPISNIVDITNLVMLECGQPLHAFDLDRFGSSEVVVRRAKDKEKFTTLDGREHELDEDVLMITNGKVGVAAAGVMGGLESEVEDTTRNILLEAAYFNASVIRRSRKKLDIVSESSTRFEKGADPNSIEYAVDRAAYLLAELAGGEVQQGIVDCYPEAIKPLTITFRPERCNAVLGTDFAAADMKQIFLDLGFEVADGEKLEVTVPTFRPDIEREIDLIEEVVRIKGFDAVENAITNIGPLYTRTMPDDAFRRQIRSILTGVGFDEMVGHGLADGRLATLLNPDLPQVRLANPASEELNVMRNCLTHNVLTVVSHNIAHRNMDLRLFEVGKAYFPPDDKNDWREEDRLVVALSGDTERTWRDRPRPFDLHDLIGALSRLAEHFHWPSIEFKPAPVSYLDDQLSFELYCDDTLAGWAGSVTETICRKVDIKQQVLTAELLLAPLMAVSRDLAAFEPLPVYPAAPRDLAVVVDTGVPAGDILDTVHKAAGDLAESVEIFDLYTGKQIEQGKKSIALSINYRSRTGNLSSDVVEKVQQKVIASLRKKLGADIRDS